LITLVRLLARQAAREFVSKPDPDSRENRLNDTAQANGGNA
jgi:hypothetical protein